jgi:hypothetical protein
MKVEATRRRSAACFVCFALFVPSRSASAQAITQRGFVEGTAFLFPQRAPNDDTRLVGDLLAREEVFVKPAPWVQLAGGLDLRANSHDQIADSWTPDLGDRGTRRPRVSVRRLTATLTRGGFVLDVGKQFIRWGKTDILTPTDRFAPRDFLNVIVTELLPVTGARASFQRGEETVEAVWVPRMTPSRVPLLDQRWTAVSAETAGGAELPLVDAGAQVPRGSETGLRWSHVGAGLEYSFSFFDGFNSLPNFEARLGSDAIELTRLYPSIRTYGADLAAPTRWFVVKGEAAYFTSASQSTDEYVLYVLQLERQSGEWVFVVGYAGEAVTEHRALLSFAPDRGTTRSFVGRAAYTIDARRSVAVEGAARQTGDGVYLKGEYSETRGQHWRVTLTGVAIAGHTDDFLGQYHRNSHLAAALRYSF